MFGHEFWESSEKCSDWDQPSRRVRNLFGRVPKISKSRQKKSPRCVRFSLGRNARGRWSCKVTRCYGIDIQELDCASKLPCQKMHTFGSINTSSYYVFFIPRMGPPSCLINAASAALRLTISRNARQSLPDNDNTPEEVVTGLSCVLHKKCVDGGRRNVCVRRLARA